MSKRCIKNYITPDIALREYLISYALLEKSLNSANLSQTSEANRWERASFFWAKCHCSAIFSIKSQLICKCVSNRISSRLFPGPFPSPSSCSSPHQYLPRLLSVWPCVRHLHLSTICRHNWAKEMRTESLPRRGDSDKCCLINNNLR